MVAMLLTSIMVTSVFSVALSAKTGGAKGDRKIMAAAGARLVSELLKNYVTGSTLDPVGPGPGGNWSLDGVSGDTGVINDQSCVDCYALTLSPPDHILTGVLPAAFEAVPYNARVQYTVIDSGNGIRQVNITTNWVEP